MFDLSALNVKEPVLVGAVPTAWEPSSSWLSRWISSTRSASTPWLSCVNDVLAQGGRAALLPGLCSRGGTTSLRRSKRSWRVWPKAAVRPAVHSSAAKRAEMPGMYAGGEYDIAGFTCGVVEEVVPDRRYEGACGDVGGYRRAVSIRNGFSLVRRWLPMQD